MLEEKDVFELYSEDTKRLKKTQDLYKEIDKLIKTHIFKKYDFR